MFSTYKLLVLYSVIATFCDGANILGVFPVKSYSFFALGHSLFKELSLRGHKVTMMSPYEIENPNPNYEHIFLEGVQESIGDSIRKRSSNKQDPFNIENLYLPTIFDVLNKKGYESTEYVLNHTKLQFLRSTKRFDIVISQQFFNDAIKSLCYIFDAHCIILGTVGAGSHNNYLVGNPSPASYIPDVFSSYSGKMSFMQRVNNFLHQVYLYTSNHLYYFPKQNALVQKYFPGAPDIYELMKVPLVLLNSDVSTGQAIPHVPNMVQIGGYHVEVQKKLPEDLQKYLDEAEGGVIYFCLGSNLNSKELPVEKRNGIMKALSKSNLKVLWKFENTEFPGKPDNVKILSWMPQQEILAHPNVKLFITHGGKVSTIESVYHGVPIIGIPIFADQKMNMALSVSHGIGLKLDYAELNEHSLSAAINEIVNNPNYTINVKKRSKIMHDQPLKPMENAIFWIEYVLRHDGALHLRSDALDLTWYQYLLLDVVLFLIVIVIAPFVLLLSLLKYIYHKKCRTHILKYHSKKTN